MRRSLASILGVTVAAVAAVAGGAIAAAAPATRPATAPAPKPIRLLILTGKNNHNWRSTTPALKKMYEASRRFTVDVSLDPSACDAKTFAKYGAVVSNWTNWPHIKKREWGPRAEKAFLDFVRAGGGFVVMHAASTPFATWPEYRELVGSWWQLGQTRHGPVRQIPVTITRPDHPITLGMKDFVTTDELWERVGTAGKLNVLCAAKAASGRLEPVAHHRTFGKGRCFHMILGHDARAIRNVGFQTLMLRGTEWAATGKATMPIPADWPGSEGEATTPRRSPAAAGPFDKLRRYKAGQSRLACTEVARIVRQAAADPDRRAEVAGRLAALLASDATKDAKAFACEQLSLVGRAPCVPAVAALLTDADLAHMARFALERIPGEAAAAALRDALGKVKGRTLIGVIHSAARRRDSKAVATMHKLLGSAEEQVVKAALAALGQMGTPQAAPRPKVADLLRRALSVARRAEEKKLVQAAIEKD